MVNMLIHQIDINIKCYQIILNLHHLLEKDYLLESKVISKKSLSKKCLNRLRNNNIIKIIINIIKNHNN